MKVRSSTIVEASIAARESRHDFEVRSLTKGLKIIETLNRYPGLTVSRIASLCALPRTTAYRSLRTLEISGYVHRDENSGSYFVRRRVLALSSAFDALADATISAREAFVDAAKLLHWPMYFVVPIDLGVVPSMQVRASSEHVGPLDIDRLLPGTRIALLQSAAGIAWLSTLSTQQQAPIIERAESMLCDPPTQASGMSQPLYAKIADAQAQGFASYCFWGGNSTQVDLAVPVKIDHATSAALTIRFAEQAVPIAEAISRFVPTLQSIARRLGRVGSSAQIRR